MTMRPLLALFVAMLWASPSVVAMAESSAPSIEVWKSATCACCGKWVEHLESTGFAVTVNAASPSMLDRIKREVGIGRTLAACHTGKIDGYVIEGHVPASDVTRLITEKPDAIGLSVPGMPIGSPGMEQDGKTEAYDVLLVKRDGTTEIFARH
jgi:hypothetical protein